MSRITLFLVSLSLLICAQSSVAQEEAPGLLDLRIVTVKPNRIAEWVELQHELNAAREEAGMTARTFMQVAIGDLDTFYIATPIEQLGGGEPERPPGEAAQWAARVNDCLVSRSNLVLQTHPGVGIAPVEGKQYDFAIVRAQTAAPGRNDDVYDWYAERLYPRLREVGGGASFLSRIVRGGNTRTWYSVSLVESWDELNAPGPFAGDERQDQDMFEDFGPMVDVSENILLRRRHDLSPN
jgi:hypothetical protein